MKKKFRNATIEPMFYLFTCVKEGRQYIEKLFSSLLSQTKKNFIHYIYDDGSLDPIDDLVDNYAKRASSLREPYKVIYEKGPHNIGLNAATKHCIDLCKNQYFIWIDCDNWVDPCFFEELEKTANKNKDAIIVRSNRCISINGKNSNFYSKTEIRKNLNLKDQSKIFFLNHFKYSFFAVKNDFYQQYAQNVPFSFDNIPLNDDQVICLSVFSGKPIVFSEKALGYVLIRKDSVGNSLFNKNNIVIERNFYCDVAAKMNYKYAKNLEFIFVNLDYAKEMINYFHLSDFPNFKLAFSNKRKNQKMHKIPGKYRNIIGCDFIWLLFTNKVVFKIYKNIRGLK